jgi:hypothetical protein
MTTVNYGRSSFFVTGETQNLIVVFTVTEAKTPSTYVPTENYFALFLS